MTNIERLNKFENSDYLYCKSSGRKLSFRFIQFVGKDDNNVVHIFLDEEKIFFTSNNYKDVDYLLENYLTTTEHREAIINSLLS